MPPSPRPGATSPARSPTRSEGWTWSVPTTTSPGVRPQVSWVWPPGPPVTCGPPSTRSPRRSAASGWPETSPTRSARRSSWPACGWPVADPTRPQRLYEQALATRRTARPGRPCPVTGDLHVGLADMLRERGDLDAAEQHLQIARDLGERGVTAGEPAPLVHGDGRASHRARGDLEAPPPCSSAPSRCTFPATSPTSSPIAAVKARIRIAQGRLADAWDWAHTQRVTISDPPTYLNEFDQLTLARLLLARRRTDPGPGLLVAELELLDRIVAIARAAGRVGSVVDALIVRALIQQAARRPRRRPRRSRPGPRRGRSRRLRPSVPRRGTRDGRPAARGRSGR